MQLLGRIDRNFRTIDIETEFENGTFLATSTGLAAAKTREFPGITRQFFSREKSPPELFELHRARAIALGLGAKKLFTVDDVLASQNRAADLKQAYKQATGYVTREDLTLVAGRPLNAEESKVADEIERANKNEQP
jgi:hypothetical protein